jgi:hypothetical protein
VVERTFAWISHNRRMAKDYEGVFSEVRIQHLQREPLHSR